MANKKIQDPPAQTDDRKSIPLFTILFASYFTRTPTPPTTFKRGSGGRHHRGQNLFRNNNIKINPYVYI